MKNLLYNLKKMHVMAIGCAFFCSTANATVYTAVVSGNFNAAATWGGIIPAGLLTSDIVVIPAGINVTLTSLQTISGTTSMTVNGTLSATGATNIGNGIRHIGRGRYYRCRQHGIGVDIRIYFYGCTNCS